MIEEARVENLLEGWLLIEGPDNRLPFMLFYRSHFVERFRTREEAVRFLISREKKERKV